MSAKMFHVALYSSATAMHANEELRFVEQRLVDAIVRADTAKDAVLLALRNERGSFRNASHGEAYDLDSDDYIPLVRHYNAPDNEYDPSEIDSDGYREC